MNESIFKNDNIDEFIAATCVSASDPEILLKYNIENVAMHYFVNSCNIFLYKY